MARSRVGERVIVAPLLRYYRGFRPFEADTLGSEIDGAFAQYTRAPSCETYRVRCGWSSVELASMPCAFATAENMLQRADLGAERVLVTGASGGRRQRRGAACQAPRGARDRPGERSEEGRGDGSRRRRGSRARPRMWSRRSEADGSISLWTWLAASAGRTSCTCCAPEGATSVPAPSPGRSVALDLRTLYLRDLTLIGCTFQDEGVFENVVSYIERGEIRPTVAKTYPLANIVTAQTDFLAKQFTGKLVLLPP